MEENYVTVTLYVYMGNESVPLQLAQISQILALISKNFKRPRDPECTPTLQNFNMCNVSTTFNIQTKFEMSSFICSKVMAWPQKYRNGPRYPDHAHLGIVRHHKVGLILHAANSCEKFEISSYDCCRYFRGCKILKCVT